MKLNILGSAGALSLPRPFCPCSVCEQARDQDVPYSRIGSSLYVYVAGVLFDTPEMISRQIDHEQISDLRNIVYTNWHPDHVLGYSVIKELIFAGYEERKKSSINVWIPKNLVNDFKKNYPGLYDYQEESLARIMEIGQISPLILDEISVTPIEVSKPGRNRYAYLIEEAGKRVMYAPCANRDMLIDSNFDNLDCLILEIGWLGDTQTYRADPEKYAWAQYVSFEENIELIRKLQPKRTILTGIDGRRHRLESGSYDALCKAARKTCLNVEIAYDGMKIRV